MFKDFRGDYFGTDGNNGNSPFVLPSSLNKNTKRNMNIIGIQSPTYETKHTITTLEFSSFLVVYQRSFAKNDLFQSSISRSCTKKERTALLYENYHTN